MVTFLAQGLLVNINNFMDVRNEFKCISLAYHIVITFIYCNLCYNYTVYTISIYTLTWRVHSLPTVGILNTGISSCCLGHAKCWAVVVLLCCSAPKPWGRVPEPLNHCSWRLQKASGKSRWKVSQLSLLNRVVSGFIAFHSCNTDFLSSFLGVCPLSVLSKSLNIISGRNGMVYSLLLLWHWWGLSFLCLDLWYLTYKSYCLHFPSWLFFFFFQNTLISLEDVLVLAVEFGSLEAPNHLWY